MRSVLDIFKSDIKAIVKYFFVLIVVLAVGFLPSLYAWINIYANWDPYSEAGNVQVALSSRDRGIDLGNGTHVNSADQVIKDVKDDKNIAYRPLNDPDEAIEGVRSGRFYAAIIFEDGFTYDMHHFEEAIGDKERNITYYSNIKKNPVASKITDQAASDLMTDINSRYLKQMLDEYFGDADDALDEMDTEETVETALEQLVQTRDAIHDYNESVTQIMSAKSDVTKALNRTRDQVDRAGRSEDISDAKKKLKQAKKTTAKVSKAVDTETARLEKAIDRLAKATGALQAPVSEAAVEKALEEADRTLTILQDLRGILPQDPETSAGRATADAMDVMIAGGEQIKALLESDPTHPQIKTEVNALKQLMKKDLVPSMELMLSEIEKAMERIEPILSSAGTVLDDLDPVFAGAGSTVNSLDSTLGGLQLMLQSLETKLDDAIAEVENADVEDKVRILNDLLGTGSGQFSEFFTDFVEVEAEELYKPVSYGAAMTPFYTIIALWVGGVMLVTLMNCSVDRRKFPQITETQGFFGRYLIFFLIGQIQAAVVVAGDIFIFHCSPVHPWLMWLSASVTSMVFVALIYALTLVFGDIGRAAVMVIMMVQIAGSSGSYPIEILPDVFDKIFRFFPFPYAINAMREAICGMYGYDYLKYLAQLMIFFLCAVAIGVFIRRPFLGVKQFMYDKMKETEVM